METQPERHYQHNHLIYLLGYYALILDTIKLSPEWQAMYEERLSEIKAGIQAFENPS